MPYHNKQSNNEHGFTLIEIALVILVIGVLLAGVFLGLGVLRNAGLFSTYSKSRIFAAAIDEFIAQYAAMPGDMEFATARLNNCTGPCANGNGDGVIGNPAQPIFAATIGPGENTLFWYHLQAAGLIAEIDMTTPLAAGNQWGQILPASDAGGGYIVRALSGVNNDLPGQPLKGIWLRWQLLPFANANGAGNLVVAPSSARAIDDKFDDGLPLSGSVRARGTNAGVGGDTCITAGGLAYMAGETASCYMYFELRGAVGL